MKWQLAYWPSMLHIVDPPTPPTQAIWDAQRAVELRPSWPKGYYRLGCGLLALSRWDEAAAALGVGLEVGG